MENFLNIELSRMDREYVTVHYFLSVWPESRGFVTLKVLTDDFEQWLEDTGRLEEHKKLQRDLVTAFDIYFDAYKNNGREFENDAYDFMLELIGVKECA